MGIESDFLQLSIVLGAAALLGILAKGLRQPLIVALLAAGILVGPAALGLIEFNASLEFFSELGIAILLFLVGLRLDIQLIRHMGPVAVATGLGQVIFTSVVGFLIAISLGMDWITSVYVAIALTFSSTIIIVKLLSDKREIDSLHGQIAVGFLIVQDIVVIAIMIVLASFNQDRSAEHSDFLFLLLRSAIFLGALYLFSRYLLPKIIHFISSSRELLVLFSIAWAALLAAGAHELGLSKEVGAFLAGISLASSPFRDALGSRLVAIRDFLLVFFFVALGSQLDLQLLGDQLGASVILSAFVLIGNPLIVILIMGFMGYRARTGFLAGLTVAQISEFSLIFAALGLSLGHIQKESLGLITLVGIITIGLSTYMITYSHSLYSMLAPWLKIFERKNLKKNLEAKDDKPSSRKSPEVIVFGLGRLGRRVASGLAKNSIRTLGVDFDPQAIRAVKRESFAALYGDAEDPEFFAELPLAHTKWIICCVSDLEAERVLVDALDEIGFKGKLGLVSLKDNLEKHQKTKRIDWWLKPFELAAERVVEQIKEDCEKHK